MPPHKLYMETRAPWLVKKRVQEGQGLAAADACTLQVDLHAGGSCFRLHRPSTCALGPDRLVQSKCLSSTSFQKRQGVRGHRRGPGCGRRLLLSTLPTVALPAAAATTRGFRGPCRRMLVVLLALLLLWQLRLAARHAAGLLGCCRRQIWGFSLAAWSTESGLRNSSDQFNSLCLRSSQGSYVQKWCMSLHARGPGCGLGAGRPKVETHQALPISSQLKTR